MAGLKLKWNSDKIYGNWVEENITQTELEYVPSYYINENDRRQV